MIYAEIPWIWLNWEGSTWHQAVLSWPGRGICLNIKPWLIQQGRMAGPQRLHIIDKSRQALGHPGSHSSNGWASGPLSLILFCISPLLVPGRLVLSSLSFQDPFQSFPPLPEPCCEPRLFWKVPGWAGSPVCSVLTGVFCPFHTPNCFLQFWGVILVLRFFVLL